MASPKNLGSRNQINNYAKARIAPLLHQIVEDVLIAKPTDPVGFLEKYVGENAEALRNRVATHTVEFMDGDATGLPSDVLDRLNKLEGEKNALKRIGRLEIQRLKEERDALRERVVLLESGGDGSPKDHVPSEGNDSSGVWEQRLETMMPEVVSHGMNVGHLMGAGIVDLEEPQLAVLQEALTVVLQDIQTTRGLDDDDVLDVSASPAQAPTVEGNVDAEESEARNNNANDEGEGTALKQALLKIAEANSAEWELTEEDFTKAGMQLVTQVESHQLCFVLSDGEELCEQLVKGTTQAMAQTGNEIQLTELNIAGKSFNDVLVDLQINDGQETVRDAALAAALRSTANAAADGSTQWLVITGDVSMGSCEAVADVVKNGVLELPGLDAIELRPSLRLIVQTDEAENVPYQLQETCVSLLGDEE